MKIRLTKVNIASNPKVPTPDADNFTPGENNGNVSVPVDYSITGILQEDVKIGKPLVILRHTRNGVKSLGIMMTSLVTSIMELDKNGMIVYTDNSIYNLEWMEDDGV